MKNKILYFAILFGAVFFILHACKKDVAEFKKDESSKVLMNRGGDYWVECLIHDFVERIDLVREDSEYEGSENWDYSIDSTLWYIEAALNYTYAFPHEERAGLLLDTLEIDMNLTSGDDVNILEILDAYDYAIDELTDYFEAIEEDEKFFISIDFTTVEDDGGNIDLVGYFYFGFSKIILPNGDWKVTGGQFGQGGICNTSTYLNYDATDKLQQELFNANSIHQLNVFFTNISTQVECEQYGVIDQSFTYSPAEISVLYHEYQWIGSNFMDCLPLSYMNTYENNIIPSINNINNDFNKNVFVEDVFWDFAIVNIYTMPYEHWHSLTIQMGIDANRLSAQNNLLCDL